MEGRVYILADNQDVTREGIEYLLYKVNKKNTVVTSSSCSDLMEKLQIYPKSTVILDYTLFDCPSVNQFFNMIDRAKDAMWMLFSDGLSEITLRQILLSKRSVSALSKMGKKETVLEAIKKMSKNEVFVDEKAKSILTVDVYDAPKPDVLTPTEKMILHEIVIGKMTKEIASEKNLSFFTVNTHRRNIFRKLHVHNVHEATKYALQAGLVDVVEYYI